MERSGHMDSVQKMGGSRFDFDNFLIQSYLHKCSTALGRRFLNVKILFNFQ